MEMTSTPVYQCPMYRLLKDLDIELSPHTGFVSKAPRVLRWQVTVF